MKLTYPLANSEEHPQNRQFISEIPKLRKLISSLNLTGLANDTKWNKLITHMRNIDIDDWCPSYRFNRIDSEYICEWDNEWWYHLPFPFISVRWFELKFIEKIHRGELIDPEVINHEIEIKDLLSSIGFEYEKGNYAFRIYGYSPKDLTEFNK